MTPAGPSLPYWMPASYHYAMMPWTKALQCNGAVLRREKASGGGLGTAEGRFHSLTVLSLMKATVSS